MADSSSSQKAKRTMVDVDILNLPIVLVSMVEKGRARELRLETK